MTSCELETLIVAQGEQADALRAQADHVRAVTFGDEVYLRGIIEFSSFCRCQCHYCGLRAANHELPRYRMTPAEVVAAAGCAVDCGLGTVVLQSGEDEWWTAERLAETVRQVKQTTGLAVTLSVGERPEADYRLWREAGADRYLLKHETADPALYASLHPGALLSARLHCLEVLAGLGYQVGSGCIVGLPGQTVASLAADLLLLQRLQVHMAGIGLLIPHPNTPLGQCPVGSAEMTLNMVALLRLLIPDVMIAATTALETAYVGGRLAALRAGANVLMPNITPRCHASRYEIYPGKQAPTWPLEEEVARARAVVHSAGRIASTGPGHSPRAVPTTV